MAASPPLEIWQEIAGLLDADDTRKLCLTCKGLMDMLQDITYRNLHFTESDVSGRSSLALASGPRRELVRHVFYAPSEPMPVAHKFHNASIVLSLETRIMLQSLHLFPNLESFKLDLGGWDLAEYEEGALYYSYEPPKDEDDEPWRKLINDTLLTDGWRGLLQNPTSLGFQVAEIAGEGGSNMTCEHQDFLAALDGNLLSHLPKVRHLCLAGRRIALIGGFHEREPISFGPLDMPQLRVFELEWARVEGEVAKFIKEHLERLERICLRDCFADESRHWERLFNVIEGGDPHNLVSFEVTPADAQEEDLEPRRFIGLEVHDSYGCLESEKVHMEDEA